MENNEQPEFESEITRAVEHEFGSLQDAFEHAIEYLLATTEDPFGDALSNLWSGEGVEAALATAAQAWEQAARVVEERIRDHVRLGLAEYNAGTTRVLTEVAA